MTRWGLGLMLVALGALAGCNGGASVYEDAARDVAAAIGATDLMVHDSRSNFAQDSGRTVRFTVRGDPVAVVPLHFVAPDRCDRDLPCDRLLSGNLAYARGQSAYAARVAQAFAPCGFRGLDAQLLNAGQEARYQFVQARLALDRAAGGPGPCVEALASAAMARTFALDDVADWAARPVTITIYQGDLSDVPEPEPPLMLGWQEALARAAGEGGSASEARLPSLP